MHPWHDISIGDQYPSLVTAIIEIPKDSKIKYELDKPSGLIKVDRILLSSVHYPANYGLIPQTYCDDEDPLDILVLGQGPVVPLSLMNCRPIGVMKMVDHGKNDDKIIAVHVEDPEYAHYTSLNDLPPHRLQMVRRFFEDYKILENKIVIVDKFLDRKAAEDTIREAHELYKTTFTK